jgi:hypothetical protein
MLIPFLHLYGFNVFKIQKNIKSLHLFRKLLMARPVRPRWMYFMRRYLWVLKGWVHQMARLESCIAKGYITHEAMKFAAEYCSGLEPR